MLLKEQKAKFSFLASDEEEEEDRKEERLRGLRGEERERRGESGDGAGQQKVGSEGEVGEKEHRRKGERDKDGHRGNKQGKDAEGRKSPAVLTTTAASSSTFSTNVLLPEESKTQAITPGSVALKEDSPKASSFETSVAGAHTPPYNGKSQVIQFQLFTSNIANPKKHCKNIVLWLYMGTDIKMLHFLLLQMKGR